MTSVSPLPGTPQPPSSTPAINPSTFQFPPIHAFPPFYTLQPNPTTRSSQLSSWSSLIQAYCRHNHLFSLTLADALSTPLFSNTTISRKLSLRDAKAIVQWMTTAEGGSRAEWIGASGKGGKGGTDGEGSGRCWVYWRRPEEWAGALEEWVERTGQKGTVLTLYEIVESDATRREEFWGMDAELLTKSLQICVKRGKAQVFGGEGSEGVKFF
ncbi:ESCRT-II complex, vps25 subunit [Lentithecium fluviatile CBS 122367]|uniref:Vacuolar protein-sorting-associated protein 25 n=1 Tax=Lentithecium fluviatile CBS 122367 TaxID=1168545 RepID=A0A6G1JKX6_9PLEO|nr:ESCRT-II complex, vps25 subunit [Lentithecium fluviatile CBS 122367]